MSRYRFIVLEKAHHSVVRLCRVLGVAKSAFYAWHKDQLSARARADEQLGKGHPGDLRRQPLHIWCAARARGVALPRPARGSQACGAADAQSGFGRSDTASLSADHDSRPEYPGAGPRSGAMQYSGVRDKKPVLDRVWSSRAKGRSTATPFEVPWV